MVIDIAIVGSGIAGLTLAVGLLQRGINVKVYERSQSFREIGAGIGFTPNAEWAMKVLDPRIHAAFKSVTVKNGTDWFMWIDGEDHGLGNEEHSREERLIHKMYLGERGFEGCHRADFLEALLKLIPSSTVHFGKSLATIVDDASKDKVELVFEDGSSVEADAVIGCDGIRSKVRRLLFGESSPVSYPTYTHKYAFRGLIPMAAAEAALPLEKVETRHMYLGPDGHALTFPVAGGKLLNVVAFTTDPEPWADETKFTAPASKADAVKAFAAFNPTVRKIIDLLPDQLDKWAVFDTWDHPVPTFAIDRTCITGDAAHAAAPYHGAGAGFAIEDAAALAHLLHCVSKEAQSSTKTRASLLRAAFEVYSSTRLERAQWLVSTSRYVGELYEWQDPKVGSDLELCAKEIDWRSKKIWLYDIDGMLDEVEQEFAAKAH